MQGVIGKIETGWTAPGIIDAIKLGTKQLPSIAFFDDLCPMVPTVHIRRQEQLLGKYNLSHKDMEAQCQPERKRRGMNLILSSFYL